MKLYSDLWDHELPGAEQYDPLLPELTPAPVDPVQQSPTVRKEIRDPVKYRIGPTTEELLLEKGLHQHLDAPQSDHPIVPYGSTKLSWEVDESLPPKLLGQLRTLYILGSESGIIKYFHWEGRLVREVRKWQDRSSLAASLYKPLRTLVDLSQDYFVQGTLDEDDLNPSDRDALENAFAEFADVMEQQGGAITLVSSQKLSWELDPNTYFADADQVRTEIVRGLIGKHVVGHMDRGLQIGGVRVVGITPTSLMVDVRMTDPGFSGIFLDVDVAQDTLEARSSTLQGGPYRTSWSNIFEDEEGIANALLRAVCELLYLDDAFVSSSQRLSWERSDLLPEGFLAVHPDIERRLTARVGYGPQAVTIEQVCNAVRVYSPGPYQMYLLSYISAFDNYVELRVEAKLFSPEDPHEERLTLYPSPSPTSTEWHIAASTGWRVITEGLEMSTTYPDFASAWQRTIEILDAGKSKMRESYEKADWEKSNAPPST